MRLKHAPEGIRTAESWRVNICIFSESLDEDGQRGLMEPDKQHLMNEHSHQHLKCKPGIFRLIGFHTCAFLLQS